MTKTSFNIAKMNKGKRIIAGGFVLAVAGIISYCVVGLGLGPQLASIDLNTPALSPLSIGMIALGTVLCLIGNVIYLKAAIDQSFEDHKGP